MLKQHASEGLNNLLQDIGKNTLTLILILQE